MFKQYLWSPSAFSVTLRKDRGTGTGTRGLCSPGPWELQKWHFPVVWAKSKALGNDPCLGRDNRSAQDRYLESSRNLIH